MKYNFYSFVAKTRKIGPKGESIQVRVTLYSFKNQTSKFWKTDFLKLV